MKNENPQAPRAPVHESSRKPVKKYMGLRWEAWLIVLMVLGAIPLLNLVTLPIMFFLLVLVGVIVVWKKWLKQKFLHHH